MTIDVKTIYNLYIETKKKAETKPINIRPHKKNIVSSVINALDDWAPIDPTLSREYAFNVVDFFSGAGGMSLGFQAVSTLAPFFEIIGGCDIDPDASKTFEHNLNAPGMTYDIQEMIKNDEALIEFTSKLKRPIESKPLIIIGCPPCQGFTTHRKRKWIEEDDDRRNDLVEIFASVAVKLNPMAIVMENVPEMLSDKYWKHFKNASNLFNENGYLVKQSIYNSASFGVPQERFRTVMIAMKREFLLPEPFYSDPKDFKTVRQAIGRLPKVMAGQVDPIDNLHTSASHRDSTIETIKAVPKNGGSRPYGVGPKCLDRIKGFSDVYGRLYWDKPAITITHYSRNPASGRFTHPEQDRGLTIREAALLQSFPMNFEFSGTFDSMFKQIGEAVPPRLAAAIAANLLVELISAPPNDDEIRLGVKSIVEPVSSSFSSVIAGIKTRRK